MTNLVVSAPARICLFGEHQDYLGLPVIPAAIDLRITIKGTPRKDKTFNIQLPDISSKEEFSFDIDGKIPYISERDYLRSGVNVVRREGAKLDHGYDCEIRSKIPINAGASSSSAMCVAWIKFLLSASEHKYKDDPEKIAYLAYLSEVEEFGEPGGMMDQCSSAMGSIIFVDFKPEFKITRLTAKLGAFVLGDSLQAKDTTKTLSRVKKGTLRAVDTIRKQKPDFNLKTITLGEIKSILTTLDKEEQLLIEGGITTRDITREAKSLFLSDKMTDEKMGDLLNAHQAVLRDKIFVSKPKLDKMIDASIKAGALGGKLTGSGEGGCMFAYAPSNPEAVAEAIEKAGGKSYIINVAEGVNRIL
ncbi:MAG: galactokinase family protein [bacterium]